MIALETQLEIQHLSKQGLSDSHIARRLGIDRRTVKRYREHPELINQPRQSAPRGSKIDAWTDQIKTYLDDDPHYRATTIFDRLKRCGYDGCYELVKRVVHSHKAEKQCKAYIRFETEPGQQAQVDFGEFVVESADGTLKKYYLFALILGYSRLLYAEFLETCDMIAFLEAHQRALAALGGVPAEILYDRMRNVFIRQVAGKTEFTQSLVSLAVHYGFTPRVAPPTPPPRLHPSSRRAAQRPRIKGKVERPFDFIRESFWRGYRFVNLETANADLQSWLGEKAQRVHGTTHERLDTRFDREKPFLLALPAAPCDISQRLYRQVRKDCTISVLGNRYVVEHTLVGKTVLARWHGSTLRLFADERLVVTYTIPEGRGHRVGEERFYPALRQDSQMQAKKFARSGKHKGRATISPAQPAYPIEVEQRDLSCYQQVGGEVGYA
jgi:transposase